MKIEITTNAKAVELVNMILSKASFEIDTNERLREVLNVTKADNEKIKTFRTQLLKSFLNK